MYAILKYNNNLFELHMRRMEWAAQMFKFKDLDDNDTYHFCQHNFEIKYSQSNCQVSPISDYDTDNSPYIVIFEMYVGRMRNFDFLPIREKMYSVNYRDVITLYTHRDNIF